MLVDIKTLTNQALTGKYSVHGDISKGDCVIGFSFGYQKDGRKIIPGISNEDIARFIEKYLQNWPLILQFEISVALKPNIHNVYKITKSRIPGQYLDTSEVATQAQEIMIKNHWHKTIIVAHPFHLPRVDAVCKKLGIETIVPSGLEAVRFDPNSSQEWTRDKKSWRKRELEAIKLSQEHGLI